MQGYGGKVKTEHVGRFLIKSLVLYEADGEEKNWRFCTCAILMKLKIFTPFTGAIFEAERKVNLKISHLPHS